MNEEPKAYLIEGSRIWAARVCLTKESAARAVAERGSATDEIIPLYGAEVRNERNILQKAVDDAYQCCSDPRTVKILRDALNQVASGDPAAPATPEARPSLWQEVTAPVNRNTGRADQAYVLYDPVTGNTQAVITDVVIRSRMVKGLVQLPGYLVSAGDFKELIKRAKNDGILIDAH